MCASARRRGGRSRRPGLSSASTRARTSATSRPARRIRSISARDLRVTMSGRPDRVVGDGGQERRPRPRRCEPRPSTVRRTPVRAVVVDDVAQGRELHGEPRPDRLGLVVRRAGSAASRRGRRRRRRAAGWCSRCRRARPRADPAAGQAMDEVLGRHLDVQRAVDPRGRARRGRRRGASAWARLRGKPSRIAPAAASCGREPGEEHPDRDVVGDELAALHVAARLEADRRAVADGRPEQVAGRDMRDAEPLREDGAWVPFPPPARPAARRRSSTAANGGRRSRPPSARGTENRRSWRASRRRRRARERAHLKVRERTRGGGNARIAARCAAD